MKRYSLVSVAMIAICADTPFIPAAAAPVDDFRLTEIENNLRALQTQLREQARIIAELQTQLGNSPRRSNNDDSTSNTSRSFINNAWLSAANWDRLRVGMSEADTLALIGPPTQMRVSDDKSRRTLLYALDIGGSGFLSGSVVLTNGQLTSVNKPELK